MANMQSIRMSLPNLQLSIELISNGNVAIFNHLSVKLFDQGKDYLAIFFRDKFILVDCSEDSLDKLPDEEYNYQSQIKYKEKPLLTRWLSTLPLNLPQ